MSRRGIYEPQCHLDRKSKADSPLNTLRLAFNVTTNCYAGNQLETSHKINGLLEKNVINLFDTVRLQKASRVFER